MCIKSEKNWIDGTALGMETKEKYGDRDAR